jgi:hypothetical protein
MKVGIIKFIQCGPCLFMARNFQFFHFLEPYTLQYYTKFLSHLNGLYTNVCGMHFGGKKIHLYIPK